MANAAADYPFGQCTWYVASRFPDLYGWMGNATNWIASAKQQGYQISPTPVPDSIAVFQSGGANGMYSKDGHVAVVDSVNNDGTFNVSEMNFNGFGQVDTRRASMDGVEGFIIPPGSQYTGPIQQYVPGGGLQFIKDMGAAPPKGQSQGNGPCVTNWSIFGANLCMDGIIGGAACAAGGLLMLGGVLVVVAAGISRSGAGRVAGKIGGPYAKLVTAAGAPARQRQERDKQAVSEKRQQDADEHTAAIRRAQVRTARARARVTEARAKQMKNPSERLAA